MSLENGYRLEVNHRDSAATTLTVTNIGGEAVGKAIAMIYFKKLAVVETISVLPQHRKKKIATELLKTFEGWAAENGATHSFMRFAPCDFADTFTLSKLLLANNYSFAGIGFIKRLNTERE